jgi:hypothetical protein
MDERTETGAEILDAMMRLWPESRFRRARSFARDRGIVVDPVAAPRDVAEALAARGWTAREFLNAMT